LCLPRSSKGKVMLEVKTCKNCDHRLQADDLFCARCGQEARDAGESMRAFVQHFLNDYFTFDSKIVRSFKPLLFNPGFLTSEFLAGRRVRYIPPLRMYLFISIVFFLMLSLQATDLETPNVEDLFWDNFFDRHLPRLFFILLPLFALLLHGLYIRSKTNSYITHFVFSLHFHAFTFVLVIVYLMITDVLLWLNLSSLNWIFAALIAPILVVYLFVAMRKVYNQSLAKRLLKVLLLLLGYSLVMAVVVISALLVLSAG
jgi:hypothetical protein